jgi:LPS sulfotransferase NodH
MMHPPLTFVICATPRTGSTLLCALLAATGVAGRPESFYRAEDRAEWAEEWGVTCDSCGSPDPASYLQAAIRAGQSENGVCGIRIQAATLPVFMDELRSLFPDTGDDGALFAKAFGPCHFIWCRRGDDVAQSISRLKAEVSQIWHLDGTEPKIPQGRAIYDAARIDAFRAEIAEGNARWVHWFAANAIAPVILDYETFAKDPKHHAHALLAAAGLALDTDTALTVANRRMANAESAIWAERYRAERGLAPFQC